MYKKVIEYKDYDENPRKETHYFNLDESEIMEKEWSTNGGLTNLLKGLIEKQDQAKLVGFYKELILMSYGEKSNDGKYFMKSPEITDAFVHTRAFSALYMELATNEEEALKFINGIIPGSNTITKEQIDENLAELLPSTT